MTRIPKNSCLLAGLLLAGGLSLAACTKKDAPAPAPAAPAAAQPAAPQKPVQKQASSAVRLAPPPVNQFDFSAKKDPFKPFVVVRQPAKPSQEESRKAAKDALPIHSFDVSQFRLIGVVLGDRENKAMVVDPGGKGYVLKVGMTIGKNDGKVTAITTGGVDVVEQFRDDNGRVRKENIKIALPRKQ